MPTPAPSTQVADNSAFGGPSAAQAAAANTAIGAPATSNNPISTSAPAASPTSPTTVVSSQPAVDHMNNTVIPAVTTAAQSVSDAQSIKAANAANEKAGLVPPGSSNSTTFITPAASKPVPPPPPPPPTPEQQLVDQNTPGMEWTYNATTGARGSEVPTGSNLAPGFTTTDVKNAPAVATAQTATTNIKQFADGTYGTFDSTTGQYLGQANQKNFQDAQGQQKAQSDITAIQNGTMPLTAAEQGTLDSISSYYKTLIDQQTQANTSLTNAVTGKNYMSGMAGSDIGTGIINKSISDGAIKIQALNDEMNSKLQAAKDAIKSGDLNAANMAFNVYSKGVDDKQKVLDQMHQDALQAVKDAQAEQDKKDQIAATAENQAKQIAATQQNAADARIQSMMDEAEKGGGLSDTQVAALQTALKNHDEAAAMQITAGSIQDPTSTAGQYSAYIKKQTAAGKPIASAGDFIAAQKYSDAYAAAKASAQAQNDFTSSDKNQSKLEGQLQKTILTSRSDLGIQEKKVSNAIDLRRLFNQYKNADGTFKLPPTGYTEMAVGLATLLSPTGIPAQSTIKDLQQATAVGDWGKVYTYMTGQQASGSSQDIFKNLSDSIDGLGSLSESLRDKYLQAETPTELEQSRVDHVLGGLPSYNKMSDGDITYMSPEQVNTIAVSKVADFRSTYDGENQYDKWLADFKTRHPGVTPSPTDIANVFNLLPQAQ